ncbi:hypothetical protein ANN_24755 [Periplaneta americana]|uniref:Uncharacterized protein n=1 Tax=Periplaneta americana TaxID=6978 RepID=A0ABQ8RZH0_PERAM|nr:hypothetical protein ANN_24754 [Periplaneta americana]KAJ4427139.1 hypothetical protein ANN_24755 [Periplaneta americana]
MAGLCAGGNEPPYSLKATSADQVSKIPFSNNTISRRISRVSCSINEQILEKIKTDRIFDSQVDESIDIGDKPQVRVASVAAFWLRLR